MTNNITILCTKDDKLLVKTFSPEGKKDYDRAFEYFHAECPIDNIFELHDLLKELEPKQDAVIIRGKLIEGIDPNRVLRRKHASGGEKAYYKKDTNGINFAMFDFDDFPTHPDLQEDERLEWLVMHLPEYCHNVTYHYQWSSQAGLEGWDTLRCHIWFWLTEPRTDTEMVLWAEETGVIDESVMRTVQLNYTGAPLFYGVENPLPDNRSGLVKKEQDSVLIPKSTAPSTDMKFKRQADLVTGKTFGNVTGFENHLASIGPRYHMPIQRAIASWVVSTGVPTDQFSLKQRVKARIVVAPIGASEKSYYLNDRYLDASIRGAISKFESRNPNAAARLPENDKEQLVYKLTRGTKI